MPSGYEPTPSVYRPEEQHGLSRPHTPRSQLRSQILETDAPVIPVVQRDTGGAKPPPHQPEGPSEYEPVHPPEGPFEPGHPAVGVQPGSPPTSIVPMPAGTPIPGGLAYDDAERERQERFGEVERQLLDAARTAAEAEDHREMEFRSNEEDRRRIFLESEERRDQEAMERRDQVWQDLEARLAGPPPPAQPTEPEHLSGDGESIIESIRTATQEAASRHASDILETIKLEREEFAREREAAAAERERLLAEAEAERVRLNEEREARIKALEGELANVRAELENEKQQRVTEEAATREREGQESQERDEALRSQLGDITNLVQEQRDMCAAKKELMDQRWEEKQGRRESKDANLNELRNMVQKLHEDLEADRVRAAEARQEAEGKPGMPLWIWVAPDICTNSIHH